jgi:hypothetical protein
MSLFAKPDGPKPAAQQPAPRPYDARRERSLRAQAAQSKSGRDIGKIPRVRNAARKKKARASFKAFCESYFAEVFYLAWSPDHLKVIAKIEQAVTAGGLFAVAMPRGSGKTSLCERAALWAIVSGRRDFVALVGADEASAVERLAAIKSELESNDALADDWPEVCYPIRCLEGITHRCRGQLLNGKRTLIGWSQKQLILPTVPRSKASGAIVRVAGITGRLRGMKHSRHDGQTVRPSLVIVDDPQTDESAASVSQSTTREAVLAGAILGLAGPGRKMAGLLPCTVIKRGDMADRILDRDKHPDWQGERTQLVYEFPTEEKLWAQYGEIRADDLRAGGDGQAATEFYRANREAMDAGARVAWPARKHDDELSALQHAMNLRQQDEAAFFAEYQNDPADPTQAHGLLTAAEIAAKQTGYNAGDVPGDCHRLTAFFDCHDSLLYWLVAAWNQDFGGTVLDYGTWPKQADRYFTLRKARSTLRRKYRGHGKEAAIYAGLADLEAKILTRQFVRDDGAAFRVERLLIDAGYLPDVIERRIRASDHAAAIMPSIGVGITAAQKPMAEYRRVRGDRHGHFWRIPVPPGPRRLRLAHLDANYWKTFIHARLSAPAGQRDSLALPKGDHRLLADHLTAEYPVRTEGRGRAVDQWSLRPGGPDNHWFDCLVGAAAAASMLGTHLAGAEPAKRPRVKLSELRGRRR